MNRVRTLSKLALELNRQAKERSEVPAIFLFTDDNRTPDLLSTIVHLPRGTGVVFRHYENADRSQLALSVSALCRKLGIPIFIAGDWRLATRCRAFGVHLPQYMISRAIEIRNRNPRLKISCACHDEKSLLLAERASVDIAFLSPLFPTKSHVAASGINPVRAARLSKITEKPVYGLGGINVVTARRLRGTGIMGIGAIEGLLKTTL